MIDYVEIHLVDHCNLNCAKCFHYAPLADGSYFLSAETLERDITRFKEICERENPIVNLLGGEPFLHPEWQQFVSIVKRVIPKAFVYMTTNGLLLKKLTQEQINFINDNEVSINTSKYPINVDYNWIEKTFVKHQILDRTYMYCACLDLSGKQDALASYFECNQHCIPDWSEKGTCAKVGCVTLREGKLYPCSVIPHLQSFMKYYHVNIEEYESAGIDIYSHSAEEIFNFLTTPYLMCKYCNIRECKNTWTSFDISKRKLQEWIFP